MSFEDEIIDMRSTIDDIDRQLIELLSQRFRCCMAVGELKKQFKVPVMQPSRVKEVVARAALAGSSHGMSPEFASRVWELIIAEACRMEDEQTQQTKHAVPAC
ncbi:chorismate mutase [Dyella tabacisoli]|nr:chorismate mutase [Dyella tabacisoli]